MDGFLSGLGFTLGVILAYVVAVLTIVYLIALATGVAFPIG